MGDVSGDNHPGARLATPPESGGELPQAFSSFGAGNMRRRRSTMSSRLILIIVLFLACAVSAVRADGNHHHPSQGDRRGVSESGHGDRDFPALQRGCDQPRPRLVGRRPRGKVGAGSRSRRISPRPRFPIVAGSGRRWSRSRGKCAGKFWTTPCGRRARIIKRWRFG